ncbi:MAG: acetamidase/formamidase family protein [Vulcanimicrobiaceae bacterium]
MRLSRTQTHGVWDRSIEPVVRIAPGATIVVELENASGGQLSRDSKADALTTLDFARINPVTGPIYIEGANPGDALVVEILDLSVEGWGWTANIPGFGLLAERFTEPALRISHIFDARIELFTGMRLPTVPMIGTIGVAPGESGAFSVVPPTRYGGNMDVRHVGAGATLYLPVAVEGALLSLGDGHAAQGDGEVCGTAIETAAVATIRVSLDRARNLPAPMLLTDPRSQRVGRAFVTTGIGPDLMHAARDAVSAMIAEIVRRTTLCEIDAYLLASVAGDLKISEIVDQPNWVVSLHIDSALLA